jgi:hypothetical protein
LEKKEKGQAQHVAFVLRFGKLCWLNRLLPGGDLP